jgi:hypothetical protein
MGNSHLHGSPSPPSSSCLLIRVQFNEFHSVSPSFPSSPVISSSSSLSAPTATSASVTVPISSYIIYSFTISYQRYIWKISKRFSEIKALRKSLLSSTDSSELQTLILEIEFPKNHFRINSKPNKLLERGELCARFIETIGSHEQILRDLRFRRFLEIGRVVSRPFCSPLH